MNLGLTAVVTPDVRRAVSTIENFDLARVKARLCVDFPQSPAELDRLEREFKRFLSLFVLEEGNHFFCEKGDDLWHYFILHTQEYREFCQLVFGRFLNHVPILPDEAPNCLVGYQQTKAVYTRYYGAPPADMWGEQEACCMGCNGSFESTGTSSLAH